MKIGHEVKYTPAGQATEMLCDTCYTVMEVSRNQPGRAGRFSALFPFCMTVIHDEFTCPHAYTTWHKQAVALLELIEETPSSEIEKILRKELHEVLEFEKATKSNWSKR